MPINEAALTKLRLFEDRDGDPDARPGSAAPALWPH